MIRRLALVALVLSTSGCNSRHTPFDGPAAPSTSSAYQPGVYSMVLAPPVTYGPAVVLGAVRLTYPAPAGGARVSLSSDDATLVSLPPTVTVPAGLDSAEFSAAVQAVSADRDVTVSAFAGDGRSATARLSLWTVLPTFFSFWSEPGDYVGNSGVRRLTPPFRQLVARGGRDYASFRFWDLAGRWWTVEFQAPAGEPLRVGTYEGATRYSVQRGSAPGLDVSGEGRGCNRLTGRFTVWEADFAASGQVRRFWATFEQRCEGASATLRGDVRVTDGPKP